MRRLVRGAAGVGTTVALAAVSVGLAAAAVARQPAYCSVPPGPASPAWAFHVGAPIFGARGTYARGHGTLSGTRATGVICQVDRAPSFGDRQILLTVTGGSVVHQGGVVVAGVLGNLLVLPVRVSGTTDSRCADGTRGTVTLLASYNGVHKDSVKLAFPRACRDHDHYYRGSGVVALVPR